jgi:hypothetical protein
VETRSYAGLVVQRAAISLKVYQACRPQVRYHGFQQRHIAEVQLFGNLLAGPKRFKVLVKESQQA